MCVCRWYRLCVCLPVCVCVGGTGSVCVFAYMCLCVCRWYRLWASRIIAVVSAAAAATSV